MRVLPRSTARALAANAPGSSVNEHPSEARIKAGQRREAARSRVLAHGCALCWGKQDVQVGPQGESVLGCAILADEGASEAAKRAAKGCQVPALYADVWSGKKLDVEPEEVEALIPQMNAEAGEAEMIREAATAAEGV